MKLNTFYKQGAALALCLTLSFPVFAEKDLVQYVNTLQGTNSTYELSWGNTYPTTAVPYPMNSWSPQTGKNGDGWKYQYSATTIRGFQPTHQCSPWVGDYGVFSLMCRNWLLMSPNGRLRSLMIRKLPSLIIIRLRWRMVLPRSSRQLPVPLISVFPFPRRETLFSYWMAIRKPVRYKSM